MSEINGGSFIQGFAAGALSSIAASAFSGGQSSNIVDGKRVPIAGSGWGGAGEFAHSTIGMIAFGTVMGGAGAALTGGNFWQGAITGLVVSGLNHAMHSMTNKNDNFLKNIQDGDELTVVYTGTKVQVVNSKGEVVFEHSATSGKGKHMNKPASQNVQNEGPIPEETYNFNTSEWNAQSPLRQLYNINAGNGDWGDFNVRLKPVTYKGSRHSFYLHGGSYPGSAGCIDVNAGIKYVRSLTLSQTNVNVIVKYGK
jgi:hypothetical protein